MYEFLEYVLWELKNSFGLVLLAGSAALAVLGVSYLVHRKRYGGKLRYPWVKAVLWLAFVGYMAIVLYATLLRASGGYRDWNLHLFRAWREAWNNFSAKNWANVLLNIAMFVPLGVLLPLLGKRFKKWYLAIAAAFAVSLGIELLQLATSRGICDVDDLFANTLGGAIGYFAIMAALSLRQPRGIRLRAVLVYASLFAMCVISVGSIFLVYEIREYGNLPMAPAYTNDTRGVSWSLDCPLPEVTESAPVYRTQTRSIAQCDAFAEEFRQIIGTEYTSVLYYQEAAYYMDQFGDDNGAHFLFLSYIDPSYEYHCSMKEDPTWIMADRQTLESALEKYPCLLPEYAEFSAQEDGWHSFTVDRHIDGSQMIDGELRCRYSQDGTIREIRNNLLSYSYHKDANIISPQEAYRRLCAGKFNDGGFFENRAPAQVSVFACRFGYAADTKGFYQPVYYFDTASPDGKYQDVIMIPAMA